MESHNGGIFHAATSLLAKFDHAQNRFLHELNLNSARAFLEFNFAPPELRRNIGVLGMLHKRVLGQCHPGFETLLPWYADRFDTPRILDHNKQLYGHHAEIIATRPYIIGLFFR